MRKLIVALACLAPLVLVPAAEARPPLYSITDQYATCFVNTAIGWGLFYDLPEARAWNARSGIVERGRVSVQGRLRRYNGAAWVEVGRSEWWSATVRDDRWVDVWTSEANGARQWATQQSLWDISALGSGYYSIQGRVYWHRTRYTGVHRTEWETLNHTGGVTRNYCSIVF
jgi:hypothetical protein